ncbi:hypothetical protein ACWPM1_14095 [Tsuneonella sp. HG249]
MKTAALLCLPLLALTGCGDNAGAEGERKTAAGEVLGGTISDEMLPLDTVTSQSPPLREEAGSGTDAIDGSTAPPRDTEGGPGEPPRDSAPAPATPATDSEAAESEEPTE